MGRWFQLCTKYEALLQTVNGNMFKCNGKINDLNFIGEAVDDSLDNFSVF